MPIVPLPRTEAAGFPTTRGASARAMRVLAALRGSPWILGAAVYLLAYGVARLVVGTRAPWLAHAGAIPVALVAGVRAARLSWTREAKDLGSARGWATIAIALLAAAAADALWTLLEDLYGINPAPTWAGNLPALVFDAVAALALLRFAEEPRSRPDRVRVSLDAATVLVAGVLAVWHFVVGPALAVASTRVGATLFLVMRSVGDLALLTATVRLVLRAPPNLARTTVVWLGVGFFLHAAGDVTGSALALDGVRAAHAVRMVVQLLGSLALLVACESQALAAQRGLRSRASGDEPVGVSTVPYVAVASGYLLLLSQVWWKSSDATRDLVTGVVGLTVFVTVRQVLAVRENARLWRERAQLLGESRLSALVRHSADAVCLLDAAGLVRWVSPSSKRVLALDPDALLGTPFRELLHEDDRKPSLAVFECSRGMARLPVRAEWRAAAREDGRTMRLEATVTNLFDDPAVRGFVVNLRDITDRAALEAQLTQQAFHDPLTSLANRSLFNDRVEQALARAKRSGRSAAVAFVDLDDFKLINDSLGHGAGDAILCEFAERLRRVVRDADTTSRLGGDEFAILSEELPDDAAANALGDRVLAELAAPFLVEGRPVKVTASMGVARSTLSDTRESLLRNADTALYAAKARRRGGCALFETSMHAAAVESLEIQTDLRAAIEADGLRVVYQPVVRIGDRRVVGMEALVRWDHPTRGELSPARFVPVAEASGLILGLGRRVLERALRDAVTATDLWPTRRPPSLSVNVSPKQIYDPGFVRTVRELLAETGFDPSCLCLEVTESVFVQRAEAVLETLNAIRATGVRLGIDDFGTGYSSLAYLRRFPLDVLKIPREFVESLGSDGHHDATLAQSIVALGSALGLRTVAEGVETEVQAKALADLGCELGQGYLYGRPMALDRLIELANHDPSGAPPAIVRLR
ncbi:MAG: EAL domain-containing protein [Planctomycetes bacterium]|nr:EAL domain-containing protein [Planctomycetota bacterium]